MFCERATAQEEMRCRWEGRNTSESSEGRRAKELSEIEDKSLCSLLHIVLQGFYRMITAITNQHDILRVVTGAVRKNLNPSWDFGAIHCLESRTFAPLPFYYKV